MSQETNNRKITEENLSINVKSVGALILIVVSAAIAYASMNVRVTILEQLRIEDQTRTEKRFEDIQQRIDNRFDEINKKLDKLTDVIINQDR